MGGSVSGEATGVEGVVVDQSPELGFPGRSELIEGRRQAMEIGVVCRGQDVSEQHRAVVYTAAVPQQHHSVGPSRRAAGVAVRGALHVVTSQPEDGLQEPVACKVHWDVEEPQLQGAGGQVRGAWGH